MKTDEDQYREKLSDEELIIYVSIESPHPWCLPPAQMARAIQLVDQLPLETVHPQREFKMRRKVG